ncbi:fungal-specific transcription factor domain-containing protein [Biscogniauxia mediterranea]|nr:fungal-specific transcription factor domain-containing protein [Biscogniauxia mediterranea]
MSSDMKSSIHRFRVSRTSPSLGDTMPPAPLNRPRSASPDSGAEKPLRPVSKPKSIPACDRCRSFKKKCSRTFPVCSLCASAGQKCSFSTPASSSAAQTHHLRMRVEWLSQYINQNLPVGLTNIESIETGTDLTELLRDASPTIHGIPHVDSPASAPSGVRDNLSLPSDQPTVDHHSIEVNTDDRSVSSRSHHSAIRASVDSAGERSVDAVSLGPSPLSARRLPPDAAARRFVDAYFRNVNRAYPFVDRNKVLRDLETFGDFAKHRRDADSTLLYLIMAIGCTTLQRAGQIPGDTVSKFEVGYSDIIQECLCRESIESVQILVLLALYSLFDPAGASAWSIVGIVSRQAMLLGLTRRASDEKSLSPTDVELRHRLFWSIFVLDRMMATSLGLPVALTDENTDVPLPGLTIDEFASPDRTQFALVLQTSRHVIQLRQMEGRILQQVHFRKQSEVSSLTQPDRRAIIQEIRAEVENWYSNGCLVSPLEHDNIPIHNSITWLSARYYFLLLLLHYPSHFNAFGPVISRAELLRFAQKHIQSTSALFQHRQLPLNRVTFCRLFPVGLVLMHTFISNTPDCSPFPARDEVTMLVNILESFPEGWVHAHQAAQIFRQFLATIGAVANYGPLHFSQSSYSQLGGPKDNYQNVLKPQMASLLALMQEILGKASCYRFLEIPDERDLSDCGVPSAGQQLLSSPQGSGRAPMVNTSVAGSEDVVMNYGWGGPLELDFL